ncbi:DUF2087 domain-containing protein [Euzebya tangerina]|uniref:DUF2087 domain-containing protein n=1 Tax=Euzebya tangerina TaxID=591198 RepID=UPI000E31CDE4|nr:DUF2087 domain-containing protein [Euzebya tangerina]
MATSIGSVLLDHDRLAVAGALAVRPMTSEELVDVSRRDRRTVLTSLGQLRAVGLVHERAGRYELDVGRLQEGAREQAEAEIPMDPVIGFGMTEDEREVLEHYFSGRTLLRLPTQRSKRVIVLARVALEFDVGRRYPESEVNAMLLPFSTDWSTLRRALVDEGFLDRQPAAGGAEYWRSGGRVIGLPGG